jgi:hypothetical protein
MVLVVLYIHSRPTRILETETPETPNINIVLVSIDTLRADHLSCYGYGRKTSPHIDAFADGAVQFDYAITQSPVTAPAHMSIFTAMSPMIHRVFNHQPDGRYYRLSDRIPTLPEILKELGYITAGFVGGGNISGKLGFERGFDLYSSDIVWERIYEDPSQLDAIRRWIETSKQRKRPLFLFLHNYLCHDPYISAPEEFRLKFLEEPVDGLPLGPAETAGTQGAVNNIKPLWEDLDLSNVEDLKSFASRREQFWNNVDLSNPAHRNHIISLYDGCISYADYVFGEVVKMLREEGIYEDSLIILLSDHGEEFYEHETHLHNYLFIETMHVPLIMRFPKNRFGNANVEAYVRIMDIMPTLLDFLDVSVNHFVQGLSFMPLLTRKGRYAPTLLSYSQPLRHIRLQENGYVYTDAPAPGGSEWLFDRSRDPRELANLAEGNSETLEQLREAGERLRREEEALQLRYQKGDSALFEADSETRQRLKALGYME